MPRRVLQALTLVTIGLLAGCVGTKPPPSSTGSTALAPSATATAGDATGSVHGGVVTLDGLPIMGASVGLKGTNFTGLSDHLGNFTFNEVPPGDYALAVSVLGFKSEARAITVQAGAVSEVVFVLADQSAPVKPYIDLQIKPGTLYCSVEVVVFPNNECGNLAGGNVARFPFSIDANLSFKNLVFELVWQPSNQASATSLELDLCQLQSGDASTWNCADGDLYEYETGGSPLFLRRNVTLDPKQTYEADVGNGYADETSQVTFDQDFTLYMALCYNAACSDGYRPDEESQ